MIESNEYNVWVGLRIQKPYTWLYNKSEVIHTEWNRRINGTNRESRFQLTNSKKLGSLNSSGQLQWKNYSGFVIQYMISFLVKYKTVNAEYVQNQTIGKINKRTDANKSEFRKQKYWWFVWMNISTPTTVLFLV